MPAGAHRGNTLPVVAPLFRRQLLFLFSAVVLLSLLTSCSTTREEAQPRAGYAVASWYGREFNGRPTASGEIFDMHAHTCAHREYPFGTIVRVTNVKNGKEIECTVNDRGPFVSGRDIDLSYGTAMAIGLLSTGRVYLEVKGRDESYVRKVRVDTHGRPGPFAVQVGSFTDSSNAERLKKALELEYDGILIREARAKGGRFYRVRVGKFDTLGKAISFAGKLGYEGYPTLVVRAD